MPDSMELSRARVLIVDDDPQGAVDLIAALDGFEAIHAADGSRALQLAMEQSFDLILANAALPGIAGMDLLPWLKSESRTRDLPVILVAPVADRNDEEEERGLRLGAVDFITKPIRPAILSARVHTHVELKRQGDLLREYLPQDALTGIANRRRFNQELLRTWARSMRAPTSVTLMLFRLDHFDRFEDHYGQSPADECLIRTARALHRHFSEGEKLAARHSHDRFALLVDGASAVEAVRRALRIVDELAIPHLRSECSAYVSASIGAVTLQAGADSTPEDGMAQAQSLLELAVQSGRRCGLLRDAPSGLTTTVSLEHCESTLPPIE